MIYGIDHVNILRRIIQNEYWGMYCCYIIHIHTGCNISVDCVESIENVIISEKGEKNERGNYASKVIFN